ncbi:MAG: hypothetical protein H6861_03660 [Rhodospirillales bacterium]|nr:hypothetical protein [Rhodospirillales bacterium]
MAGAEVKTTDLWGGYKELKTAFSKALCIRNNVPPQEFLSQIVHAMKSFGEQSPDIAADAAVFLQSSETRQAVTDAFKGNQNVVDKIVLLKAIENAAQDLTPKELQ